VSAADPGRAITPKEHMMSTIYNPDPTTGTIPPASGVAQASAKTESSISRKNPVRRKIGGAFGALAVMVGTLAVVTSVAAPTASAMTNECLLHAAAAHKAESLGMDDWAAVEWAAFDYCSG
jgi:hypothetical protein